MASRDKKSAVGRKQAPSGDDSSEPGLTQQVPENVGKVASRRKRPITLKTQPKPTIVTSTLLGRGKRTLSLMKNGPAPGNPVIRKRPLSLRERIVPPRRNDIGEDSRPAPRKRIKQEPVDAEDSVQSGKSANRSNKRMKKVKENEASTLGADIVIKKEPVDEDIVMQNVAEVETKEKKAKNVKKAKTTTEADKKAKLEKEFEDLDKSEAFDSLVIDSLDLNVTKVLNVAKKALTLIRRHSIEKFPISIQDVKVHDSSAFVTNPKIVKPVKKTIRPRPSSESRARSSPYATRSDSPMRILRNGKTRRLQQYPLFDGLDSEYKMRRRLASDFSGSEISKLSGYESDSSLSSSVHETNAEVPAEKTTEKDTEQDEQQQSKEDSQIKKDLVVVDSDKEKEMQLKKEILETLENNPPDTEEGKQILDNVSAAIKRSLSLEATTLSDVITTDDNDEKTIDTNSNLCKSEPTTPSKTDFVSDVPKLLGIMKQAFNDKGVTISEEPPDCLIERRKTRSSVKKSQTPELTITETPTHQQQQQLPATTISTLTAVGIALGPDITVTAEEVTTEGDDEAQLMPPTLEKEVDVEQTQVMEEEGMQEDNDTVEEAEAELIDILSKRQKTDKSSETTPSTSVNGDGTSPVDESPESLVEKSQILKALGLQTLQEAEEARKKQVLPKSDNYTGTLKTVIKLNRCAEKKKSSRNPIKMTLQKKGRTGGKDNSDKVDEDEYKIMNEGTSWKQHSQGGQSSDTAGAQRKSHYSNRSNMDGSSEHTSDGDTNQAEEGAPAKLLVIPEKASSFSIHPGRLCKDECSYCFGKFGLFDTPCHIAQIKTVERQDKILANERHLTRDSCLCDACYRHVDRKVNMMAYMSKSVKRNALVAPAPRQNHCHVLGCNEVASNILKRKWLIKMRKAVCQVINIDLDNPGLHSIPTCKEHYAAVEHLMVCAMCKRRLARNHIHYLGSESNELQNVLNSMSIPVKLNEKPVVCKLCRYFAALVLKSSDELDENGHNFFIDYRKRLLHFHNVEPMDDCDATEPILAPIKQESNSKQDQSKKRKRERRHNNDPPVLEPQIDIHDEPNDAIPSSDSRPDSPSDYTIDYRNLIPSIAMECLNDVEITKKSSLSIRRISKAEAQEKKRIRSDIAVQRLGSNPSISIRQMFPGEEDVPLNGSIEFNNVKERTPEGWEKCTSTIQYDPDTKALWQELQKPYGNQSSFLRHLVLLEKYFRNGDLVLSPRASNLSVSYTESVQNRLRAYDNISSNASPVQPLTMLPFNNPKLSFNTTIEKVERITDKTLEKIDKSQTSIIPVAMSTPNTAPTLVVNQAQLPKNVPLTITQANTIATASKSLPIAILSTPTNIPSVTIPQTTQITATSIPLTAPPSQASSAPPTQSATTTKSKPPGLISLQQAQANKVQPVSTTPKPPPQSQKIKFPITKNWRPKLIPIDPNAKQEKKPGLVQVISGGKPYHITMEDYKKMCAIKRTYDLRQKRLQESQKPANPNSLLKSAAHKLRTGKSPNTSDQEENSSEMKSEKTDCSKTVATPSLVTSAAVLPLTADNKMPMILPKIPKSLTVIPQTFSISSKSRSNSPNQHNSKGAKAKS